MKTVNMVELVVRYQSEPLAMLEHGFAALRFLSENGLEASRVAQTRALVMGLVDSGAFLEVAEALISQLVAQTHDTLDGEILMAVKDERSRHK